MIQLDVLLPLPINHSYTYRLPLGMDLPGVGVRVVVPFGAKKWHTGIVWRSYEPIEADHTIKEVIDVLDDAPLISERQMVFFEWLSSYYMSPLGLVLKAALPSALLLTSQTLVQLTPEAKVDPDNLSDQGYMMLEALAQNRSLPLSTLLSMGAKSTGMQTINSLVDQGLVLVEQDIKEKYTPKYETLIYSDADPSHQGVGLPPKQKAIFLWAQKHAPSSDKRLKKKLLVSTDLWSPSAYRSLVEKKLLCEVSVRVDRIIWDPNQPMLPLKPLHLHQNKALSTNQRRSI